MKHKAFREGNFDTNFVNTHFQPSLLQRPADEKEALVAALVAAVMKEEPVSNGISHEISSTSLWKMNRL
jgi:hypothetical protein